MEQDSTNHGTDSTIGHSIVLCTPSWFEPGVPQRTRVRYINDESTTLSQRLSERYTNTKSAILPQRSMERYRNKRVWQEC
jgi:hypothetical protein